MRIQLKIQNILIIFIKILDKKISAGIIYLISIINGVKMEEYLISCCAPTLAGKKPANIFNLRKDRCPFLNLEYWNNLLKPFNIKIKILKEDSSLYFIYVYREDPLKEILSKKDVQKFLHNFGYSCKNFVEMMDILSYRISKSEEFPHEIGIFLGYPLLDVQGFIKNRGKCYKCCGQWKVYDDVKKCEKLFCEYDNCRKYFSSMRDRGYDLLDIMKNFEGGNNEKSCSGILVRNGQYGSYGECCS